jgi:hypothetical protein
VLVDSAVEKPQQITAPAIEKPEQIAESAMEKVEQIPVMPAENEVSKENIAVRKTVVYATVVDAAAIKESSNRIKQQLFTKYVFLGPNLKKFNSLQLKSSIGFTMRFTENMRLIIIANPLIQSRLTRQ